MTQSHSASTSMDEDSRAPATGSKVAGRHLEDGSCGSDIGHLCRMLLARSQSRGLPTLEGWGLHGGVDTVTESKDTGGTSYIFPNPPPIPRLR